MSFSCALGYRLLSFGVIVENETVVGVQVSSKIRQWLTGWRPATPCGLLRGLILVMRALLTSVNFPRMPSESAPAWDDMWFRE